jgi:cation transport regulator
MIGVMPEYGMVVSADRPVSTGGKMPYKKPEDLPESVRNVLPLHAQEIYLAAFNNAWSEYRKADDRQGDASREEVAHKVAWSAVKQGYEKKGEKWRKK